MYIHWKPEWNVFNLSSGFRSYSCEHCPHVQTCVLISRSVHCTARNSKGTRHRIKLYQSACIWNNMNTNIKNRIKFKFLDLFDFISVDVTMPNHRSISRPFSEWSCKHCSIPSPSPWWRVQPLISWLRLLRRNLLPPWAAPVLQSNHLADEDL